MLTSTHNRGPLLSPLVRSEVGVSTEVSISTGLHRSMFLHGGNLFVPFISGCLHSLFH